MKRIGFVMKDKLNNLAKTFYKMQGYDTPAGFDFQAATHPHEELCWNQAVVAGAALYEDDSILNYINL